MNPSMLSASVIRRLLFVARRDIPKKTLKSPPYYFTGKELVDHFHANFNENGREKEEITEYIRSTLASEELTLRFIWPYKGRHEFAYNSKKHVLLSDHLYMLGKDPLVLNVDSEFIQKRNDEVEKALKKDFESSGVRFPGMKKRDLNEINERASKEMNLLKQAEPEDKENITPAEDNEAENEVKKDPIMTIPAENTEPNNKTYFFEESYKDISILNNIQELVDEIQWTMLRIKGKAIDMETFMVDYSKIEGLEDFQVDFKNLVAALPFADIKTLCQDKKINMAFFINLYNILTIHSLVSWKKLKGRLHMSSSERVGYFNMFKYCVGGMPFSLNDIEHGILRANDNFGRSKWRVYWAGIVTKSFTDRHTQRFKKHEGAKKLVLSFDAIGMILYWIKIKE